MKINKITSIICILITIISGIVIMLIEVFAPQFAENTVIQSLLSGIFTGFTVSVVTSLIGYFYERSKIIENIDNNIKSLYINMSYISRLIGYFLPYIHNATDLSKLPFKEISRLSKLNVDFLEGMNLGLFTPFFTKSKIAKIYSQLNDFKNKAYNIKSIIMDIELQTLDYTSKDLQLQNNQLRGMLINPIDIDNLKELKNLINLRTAKLHEHITAQTLELEKIAISFYDFKCGKQSWNSIKEQLMLQIENIVRK